MEKIILSFSQWMFSVCAVVVLKSIKSYFRDDNNVQLKKLLSAQGFHPSVVNHPSILFSHYGSMPIIYCHFWAKFGLKVFVFFIRHCCRKNQKCAALLKYIGLKQAYLCDNKLMFDKPIRSSYVEIMIPCEENSVHRKVAIYTVMVGDYDEILDPVYVSDNCDYILFTDNINIKTKIWEVHLIEKSKEHSNKWYSRYYKILPHKVLAKKYDSSIYVDASLLICGNILQMVDCLSDKYPLVMVRHRVRTSLKQEMDRCIDLKHILPTEAEKQYQDYVSQGFTDNLGLIEAAMLIRRHKDVRIQNVMDIWFCEFEKYPARDQLSIMYSLWKNKMQDYYIVEGSALNNQFVIGRTHNLKKQ